MYRASIDLGNIRSGLLRSQIVLSAQDFYEFKEKEKGIPLLVPADPKLFHYNEGDIFEIDSNLLLRLVFDTNLASYIGYQVSYQTSRFLADFKIRKNVQAEVDFIVHQNREVLNFVGELKSKYSTVGAFQTRNIPHFGHEKIIEMMLDHCDHVVVNPIVGAKKKGDVRLENLEMIFKDLLANRFNGRASFKPIYANMFYAGPREAVHHAILRRDIGFTHFSVGRDHAGAEKMYPDLAAPTLLNKIQNKIGINILTHNGAYFCVKCNKVVLLNTCGHSADFLNDISGSEFRTCIEQRKFFKLANKDVQRFLSRHLSSLFEK